MSIILIYLRIIIICYAIVRINIRDLMLLLVTLIKGLHVANLIILRAVIESDSFVDHSSRKNDGYETGTHHDCLFFDLQTVRDIIRLLRTSIHQGLNVL